MDLSHQPSDPSSEGSSPTSSPPDSVPKTLAPVDHAKKTPVSALGSARVDFLPRAKTHRIVVDELADYIPTTPPPPRSASMRTAKRSVMRMKMSSRTASRNGYHSQYRRDLSSRGMRISRDSISDIDDAAMAEAGNTPQNARQSSTGFKKIRQPGVVRGRRVANAGEFHQL